MNEVSVVICARNAARTIDECLRSVEANSPAEIIIIDDGSTDDTIEIASRYTEKIYLTQGKGQAYRRQFGAEKAAGEYIAYVDSDVVLSENCLQIMLQELKEKGYVGIHAQVIGRDNKTYWERAEDQHFRMKFNREGERSAIPTMAAIYNRSAILKYKFDPHFSFFGAPEDGELCYRLRRDGHKLGVSSAFVYHQHRASAKAFIKQRISYGRGNALYFWRHPSPMALLGASLLIPFGIYACLRKRSLKMLPYYFVWSVSRNIGMASELPRLMLRTIVPKNSMLKSDL